MPKPYACETRAYVIDGVPDGYVLIENESSAISAGTELAVYTGIHQWLNDPTRTWPRFPFVPGYSGVGRIIEAGQGVSGFQIGQRVIYPARHETHGLLNVRQPGALCYSIADHVSAKAASVVVLARFPFAALVQAREMLGQCVVVLGAGMIGQLALRLFSAAGAFPLISIDGVVARREMAEELSGAAASFAPEDTELKAKLRAANHGALPDIVVEATGNPQAVKLAMDIVADGGKVIMVGSPRGIAGEVDFYWNLHGRSIQLIGAHGSAIGQDPREKFPFVLPRAMRLLVHLVESGKLNIDDLISHHVHASTSQAMYDGLLNRKDEHLLVSVHW
jgi:2-desacetyl-2-hydroxyethyl bacteriochlorophyllide A dehydrogenase